MDLSEAEIAKISISDFKDNYANAIKNKNYSITNLFGTRKKPVGVIPKIKSKAVDNPLKKTIKQKNNESIDNNSILNPSSVKFPSDRIRNSEENSEVKSKTKKIDNSGSDSEIEEVPKPPSPVKPLIDLASDEENKSPIKNYFFQKENYKDITNCSTTIKNDNTVQSTPSTSFPASAFLSNVVDNIEKENSLPKIVTNVLDKMEEKINPPRIHVKNVSEINNLDSRENIDVSSKADVLDKMEEKSNPPKIHVKDVSEINDLDSRENITDVSSKGVSSINKSINETLKVNQEIICINEVSVHNIMEEENIQKESESDSEISVVESTKCSTGSEDDLTETRNISKWKKLSQVKYSYEEDIYYKKNLTDLQRKLEKATICTACYEILNHNIITDVYTHPVLGVLLCKKCFHFYGEGKYVKDAEGFDEYCRWCANGGKLLLCDDCTNGFCKKCIKRNLGRTAERIASKAKSWICYVCDNSQLIEIRAFHRLIIDSILEKNCSKKNKTKDVIPLKKSKKTVNFAGSSTNKGVKIDFKFGKCSKEKPRTDKNLEESKAPSKEKLRVDNNLEESKAYSYIDDLEIILEQSLNHIKVVKERSKGKRGEDPSQQICRRVLRLTKALGESIQDLEKKIKGESGIKEVSFVSIETERNEKSRSERNEKSRSEKKNVKSVCNAEKNSVQSSSKQNFEASEKNLSDCRESSKKNFSGSKQEFEASKKDVSDSDPEKNFSGSKQELEASKKDVSDSDPEKLVTISTATTETFKTCLENANNEIAISDENDKMEVVESEVELKKDSDKMEVVESEVELKKDSDKTEVIESEVESKKDRESGRRNLEKDLSENANGIAISEEELSDSTSIEKNTSGCLKGSHVQEKEKINVDKEKKKLGTNVETNEDGKLSKSQALIDYESSTSEVKETIFSGKAAEEDKLSDTDSSKNKQHKSENEKKSLEDEIGSKKLKEKMNKNKSSNSMEKVVEEKSDNSVEKLVSELLELANGIDESCNKKLNDEDTSNDDLISDENELDTSNECKNKTADEIESSCESNNFESQSILPQKNNEKNALLNEKDDNINREKENMESNLNNVLDNADELSENNNRANAEVNKIADNLDRLDNTVQNKEDESNLNEVIKQSSQDKCQSSKSDSSKSPDSKSDSSKSPGSKLSRKKKADEQLKEVSSMELISDVEMVEIDGVKVLKPSQDSVEPVEGESCDENGEPRGKENNEKCESENNEKCESESNEKCENQNNDKQKTIKVKNPKKNKSDSESSNEKKCDRKCQKNEEEECKEDKEKERKRKKKARMNEAEKARRDLLKSDSDSEGSENSRLKRKSRRSKKVKNEKENNRSRKLKKMKKNEKEKDNSHSEENDKSEKDSADNDNRSKKSTDPKNKVDNKNEVDNEIEVDNKINDSCYVKVEKLSENVTKELDSCGFINLNDFPILIKKALLFSSLSENSAGGSNFSSDEELENLLNTKISKTKSKKKAKEASDCSLDEEQEEEKEEEKTEKKSRKKIEKEKTEDKEGLLDIDIDSTNECSENEDDTQNNTQDVTLNASVDNIKKALLMSSDNDSDNSDNNNSDDNLKEKLIEEELEEKRRARYEKKKDKLKTEREQEDSDEEDEEIDRKRRKLNFKNQFSSGEEAGSSEEDSDVVCETSRKKRMCVDSDSDFEKTDKQKLFEETSSEEGSSQDDKTKKKKEKRKRIKTIKNSSSENEVDDEDESPKKRRRRIIDDDDLVQTTKEATQDEQERRKRVRAKQSQYNEIFEVDVENDSTDLKKLVLDFDEETKEELVTVSPKLLEYLKPHQVKGIRFMWDTTIEKVERLEKGEKGGGCVLAHCMGLGKTLQVIAFIHTLLKNERVSPYFSRIMICCPVNTVLNWRTEFDIWLKGKMRIFDVYDLIDCKDNWKRSYRLDDWFKEGGVCILGYDMFRNLSSDKKKFKKHLVDVFQKALINPGPDLIVCDEGHMLKNSKAAINQALTKVKTRRRMILTGTPLQNNLLEYHVMIQFVKPNLLGNKSEFSNRFVNPITNGQDVDASPRDVRTMKRRAHILHDLLDGCVQRYDYSVLKPYLPKIREYVIKIQVTDIQAKLYEYYLENLSQGGPKKSGSGLFVDFTNLGYIWSHPAVLYRAMRRKYLQFEGQDKEEIEELEDAAEMKDFIDDGDASSVDDSESDKDKSGDSGNESSKIDEKDAKTDANVAKEGLAENNVAKNDLNINNVANGQAKPTDALSGLNDDGSIKRDWWREVLKNLHSDDSEEYDEDKMLNQIEISNKLFLLLDILRECGDIEDKILLFSQSILVLDMIEEFLRMLSDDEIKFPCLDENDLEEARKSQFGTSWICGRDYVRMDGSTPVETRKILCKKFNNVKDSLCRLFLISTRAGGIGINLVGANRVIIFDSSWNPSHDTQSIFRVYRFGQKKPCYVYRFVAQGTMEEKIYSRQVNKISTSLRVVDEHQIKRYYKSTDLMELYEFTPAKLEDREIPAVPEDRLLAELLLKHKDKIVSFHEHESLLEHQTEEQLSPTEREEAWAEYENEKKNPQVAARSNASAMTTIPDEIISFDKVDFRKNLVIANPQMSDEQIEAVLKVSMQNIYTQTKSDYANLMRMLFMVKNPNLWYAVCAQLMTPELNTHALVQQNLVFKQKLLEDKLKALREGGVVDQEPPTPVPQFAVPRFAPPRGAPYQRQQLSGNAQIAQIQYQQMLQRMMSVRNPMQPTGYRTVPVPSKNASQRSVSHLTNQPKSTLDYLNNQNFRAPMPGGVQQNLVAPKQVPKPSTSNQQRTRPARNQKSSDVVNLD